MVFVKPRPRVTRTSTHSCLSRDVIAVIFVSVDSLDKAAQEGSMARETLGMIEVVLYQKPYGLNIAKHMRVDGAEITAKHGHFSTEDELIFAVQQSYNEVSG